MTPATQEQIEEACMTRSGEDAWRFLLSQGYRASKHQCKRTVSAMLADGRRQPLAPVIEQTAENSRTGIFEVDAPIGCRLFLRRLLETGHHHINDPAKMGDALRMAGMVS